MRLDGLTVLDAHVSSRFLPLSICDENEPGANTQQVTIDIEVDPAFAIRMTIAANVWSRTLAFRYDDCLRPDRPSAGGLESRLACPDSERNGTEWSRTAVLGGPRSLLAPPS